MIWCNDHHGRAGADAYLATSLGAPSARWWLPIPTLAAAATAQIETMSKFPPGMCPNSARSEPGRNEYLGFQPSSVTMTNRLRRNRRWGR